eukprot:scaffold7387_cov231-Pinguiococcus_pyrenoidosus.AAC.2
MTARLLRTCARSHGLKLFESASGKLRDSTLRCWGRKGTSTERADPPWGGAAACRSPHPPIARPPPDHLEPALSPAVQVSRLWTTTSLGLDPRRLLPYTTSPDWRKHWRKHRRDAQRPSAFPLRSAGTLPQLAHSPLLRP